MCFRKYLLPQKKRKKRISSFPPSPSTAHTNLCGLSYGEHQADEDAVRGGEDEHQHGHRDHKATGTVLGVSVHRGSPDDVLLVDAPVALNVKLRESLQEVGRDVGQVGFLTVRGGERHRATNGVGLLLLGTRRFLHLGLISLALVDDPEIGHLIGLIEEGRTTKRE